MLEANALVVLARDAAVVVAATVVDAAALVVEGGGVGQLNSCKSVQMPMSDLTV